MGKTIPFRVIINEHIVLHRQFKVRDLLTHPSKSKTQNQYTCAFQKDDHEKCIFRSIIQKGKVSYIPHSLHVKGDSSHLFCLNCDDYDL